MIFRTSRPGALIDIKKTSRMGVKSEYETLVNEESKLVNPNGL
jgi:hypothetical protein